ncbi:MAG: hypothetical protein H0T73_07325 [Ardenticatenales bacterium]|nr:hypothetical protein [Ardenticatenales bacterium]
MLWERDFLICADINLFNSIPDGLNVRLNPRPRGGPQNQYGNLSFSEILLILEVLICGDEQLISSLLGGIQQLTIGKV